MSSKNDGSEVRQEYLPVSRGRKLVDTIVWVVIPLGFAVVLAVKYWPH
ncbi:MAG TPA: hypothetical protein VFQ35_04835 [Polyangiaceae bacterium]|nr:hypothetical protein [Polyangiaceae bacterium]